MSTQQDAADGEWEEITPSFEMTESSELEPVAVAAALQRLGAVEAEQGQAATAIEHRMAQLKEENAALRSQLKEALEGGVG